MSRRSLRNKSLGNRTPYKHRPDDDQSMVLARRQISLRLQHSISLHVPMEELDGTAHHMNCYIDLGHKKFSLTYLEENDTQNPDSLQVLEELKKRTWQTYFVSSLYNFNYTQNQMASLSRALKTALSIEFQHCRGDMSFNTEVIVVEDFNPTTNDNQALNITATRVDDEKVTILYEGYLISWCNPEKSNDVLLPILICCGQKKYQTLIHTTLSEKLDTRIERMVLTQEEFLHLSTYCLIMLDENDNFPVKMTFEKFCGIIHIEINVESLLKIWKKIHKDDSIEVELDEVLLFNEAFEKFMECSTGMALGCTLLQSVNVKGCYSLKRNGQMKFFSTKTIHVVLKYLNCLAVQRLKTRAQISSQVNGSSSELPSVTL